jgi:hypothetical protein
MTRDLTPLEVCERLVGPIEVFGPIAGVGCKAPYNWRHARGLRQSGEIPYDHYKRALLAHSDRHGLGLTAEHLIRGASQAEIDAILAARPGPGGEGSPGGMAPGASPSAHAADPSPAAKRQRAGEGSGDAQATPLDPAA